MEECIDELSDARSTPASRRIAHRYLEAYEKLTLRYDPTRPVQAMPEKIKRRIAQWKRDRYWGSFWQLMDESSASSFPPLNVATRDVPDPAAIPYRTPKEIALFKKYYKFGYLSAVNGHVAALGLSSTPGEDRKIVDAGIDAGVHDGNVAKIEAYQEKLYGPGDVDSAKKCTQRGTTKRRFRRRFQRRCGAVLRQKLRCLAECF
jgi:hypothetical protein